MGLWNRTNFQGYQERWKQTFMDAKIVDRFFMLEQDTRQRVFMSIDCPEIHKTNSIIKKMK